MVEKDKLVIFGAGHLAKEVVHFVEYYKLYNIVGFSVDKKYITADQFMGRPVYPAEDLDKYIKKEEVKLFVAISWYNHLSKYKAMMFEILKEKGFHFANLVAPNAVIHTEDIGEGNWIHEFVYVGFNTIIGDNNVIMTKATLSHYDVLGNHNVIGNHCNLLGHVTVGDRCFLGSSSTVFNKTCIGNQCVVGAGSIVKKKLKDCSMTLAAKCKVVPMDEKSIEQMINYVPEQ